MKRNRKERLVQVVYWSGELDVSVEDVIRGIENYGNKVYHYRDASLDLKKGDIVDVPPTVRTDYLGSNEQAMVIGFSQGYKGPTHAILRKHVHRYVPQPSLCRCAKTHLKELM